MAGAPRPPGHSVPAGVDPAAPESVLAWTQSFGTAFSAVLAAKNVAQRLQRAGYVDLYSLVLGAEDLMNLDAIEEDEDEDEQLLPTEARRLAVAAAAICRDLGVVPHVEDGVVTAQAIPGGVRGTATLKDRGDCPGLVDSGTKVSVVPGVGGHQDLDMWHSEVTSWIADWSPQLAATVQALRVNPSQDLNLLRGGVVAADEKWCGTKVLQALGSDTKLYLGPSVVRDGRVLTVLKALYEPVFAATRVGAIAAIQALDRYPEDNPARRKGQVYPWLRELERMIQQCEALGEAVSAIRKDSLVKQGVSAIKEAKSAIEMHEMMHSGGLQTNDTVFQLVHRMAVQWANEESVQGGKKRANVADVGTGAEGTKEAAYSAQKGPKKGKQKKAPAQWRPPKPKARPVRLEYPSTRCWS